MAYEIIMPKAGMAMEEGTVLEWFKKEGDYVETGEAILLIETDKVSMEVEAETSGTIIKITGKPGDVLPVFTVIGYIGEEGEVVEDKKEDEKVDTEIKEKTKNLNEIEKEATPIVNDTEKIRATPASRRVAKENNIDLNNVNGSGPNGRVQASDVEEYLNSNPEIKATPLAKRIAEDKEIDLSNISGSGFKGKIRKDDLETISSDEQLKGRIIPLKGMRKIIADRMSESYYTAPTVTLNIEIDMTNSISLRKQVIETIKNKTGKKISFNDIIIKATALALKDVDIVNSSFTNEGIIVHENINIAIAVGLDDGLLTPVIRDADKKSLSQIVIEAKDLQERTVSGKLNPDELTGSTFTISNLGMYNITSFNPIINQPNTAILGVCAIQDKMVVIDKEPQIRPMMTLCATIDHRVIDGVPGAKFLNRIKEILENPWEMLV